jgi:isoquinoline 1-oxidoreductase subunit beta
MNEVTIAGGAPQPQHFGDYPVMRMSDMPELRIRVLESTARPEGVGEPPVIPVAPAFAAAVSELRGAPVRSLPIRAARPAGSARTSPR